MSPTIILAILLALSVAGNGWQYHEHGKDLVQIGTTKQLADDTKLAAQTCSTSVDKLATKGETQHAAVLASLQAQAGKVADLKGATIAALNAKPADPADLCKSLAIYLHDQIKAEKTGGPK
jgi:hypothetical protein